MEIFSVIPVTEEGTDALPEPEVPYYALAKEGIYLHRKTQIGTVLIKQPTMPKNAFLAKLGHDTGLFTWTRDKIPAKIIAQATSFFTRIYDKYGTEAEILLTMHNETGAVRIFVPYQRVNGSAVKSIYDHTHIDHDYTVIGTIHSHCNFSAFHSGTDSADAADMDGVHFTIGNLKSATPQIVAMVVMNKKEFHYKDPSDIAEIDFTSDTAPDWWDQYVFPTVTDTAKPKKMRSITQEQWDAFRGMTPVKVTTTTTVSHVPTTGYQRHFSYRDDWESSDSDYLMGLMTGGYAPNRTIVPFQPTKESQKFNKRHKHGGNRVRFDDSAEQKALDRMIDEAILKDMIVPSDWTKVQAHEMDDMGFWRQFLLDKLDALCDVLELARVGVTYSAKEM
jgi:hypothetical protein